MANFLTKIKILSNIYRLDVRVAELADAYVWGAYGYPCGFKSHLSHQNKKDQPTGLVFFVLLMGLELRRKFACKFPFRVNSGHPLFIGYGRTGESFHLSHHDKTQIKACSWFEFFCLCKATDGTWTQSYVAKRSSIWRKFIFYQDKYTPKCLIINFSSFSLNRHYRLCLL